MKRRLLIALLALATVLLVLWLINAQAERRGRYQGKPIREWAAQLYATYEPAGTNAAAQAFQAMGSNAVPSLRLLLHQRDPLYEKAFLKYARHLPARLRTYLFQKLKPGRTIEYRLGTVRALGVLGPTAAEALPEMLDNIRDSDAQVRWTTAQTIHRLGPNAITALIPLTTNSQINVRHASVYALAEAHTNALPALPSLIRCTADPDEAGTQLGFLCPQSRWICRLTPSAGNCSHRIRPPTPEHRIPLSRCGSTTAWARPAGPNHDFHKHSGNPSHGVDDNVGFAPDQQPRMADLSTQPLRRRSQRARASAKDDGTIEHH
ncbi:MAG: HEAT repeat domain-containing protein [Verrucomicrobiota bacterium]